MLQKEHLLILILHPSVHWNNWLFSVIKMLSVVPLIPVIWTLDLSSNEPRLNYLFSTSSQLTVDWKSVHLFWNLIYSGKDLLLKCQKTIHYSTDWKDTILSLHTELKADQLLCAGIHESSLITDTILGQFFFSKRSDTYPFCCSSRRRHTNGQTDATKCVISLHL